MTEVVQPADPVAAHRLAIGAPRDPEVQARPPAPSPHPRPLRIGVLGVARITEQAIVEPAGRLGHRLVAVAARDRDRAEAFAAAHGVDRVHESYADVIADPEVDLIYLPLVNSLHAKWTIAALEAGKHVLCEKPLAANAEEAMAVRDAAGRSSRLAAEGLNYLHHPVNLELREVVSSGVLGDLTGVEVELALPGPEDPNDPRWQFELGGGATMYLGSYVLSLLGELGRWSGAEPAGSTAGAGPSIVSAVAEIRARRPEVDRAMEVKIAYPSGLEGVGRWRLEAPEPILSCTVRGTRGTVVVPSFAVPHLDNRIEITIDGRTEVRTPGDEKSFVYQLAAVAESIRTETPFPIDLDASVATALLIDECYRLAGMTPRGHTSTKPKRRRSRRS